jgi:hypothetical protein
MHSATVQSTKIDSIIVNIPRFIDIPFRELSFLAEAARIEGSGYGSSNLRNGDHHVDIPNAAPQTIDQPNRIPVNSVWRSHFLTRWSAQ